MNSGLIALSAAVVAIAAQAVKADELAQIDANLATHGEVATLQRFFDCSSGQGYELIAAGSPRAISLAVTLLKHSDGCFSEGLHSAVAGALQVNPDAVLLYFNSGQLSPQADCIPFISVEAPRAKARAVLRRLEDALRGVTRPQLQSAKAKCLEQVADYRRAMAQPAQPVYQQAAPLDLTREFGTARDWQAVVTAALEPQTQIQAYGQPSQSKICFVPASPDQERCADFKDLFNSRLSFQGLSGLSVVPLRSALQVTNGLVMKAVAWYDTGQIPETAIWTYQKHTDTFQLAAAVTSPEARIFSSGPLQGYLVTADWHPESGETRFGSNHKRKITVYRYLDNDGTGVYRRRFAYVTATKYDPENTRTINAELGTIQKRISGIRN